MYKDVISANYKGEYKIEVVFEDGASGTIDFSKYVSKGGVFDKLKNQDFFKKFQIDHELGVLTWEGEIDIAPETLYAEATGNQLPKWMNSNDSPSLNTAPSPNSEDGQSTGTTY